MNKYYITTPIFYVNSHPHLGHLYVTLVADTLARYKRQRGVETFFLTGTDEHGQNIERAAEAKGVAVSEHVDAFVAEFQEMFAAFNIREDHWVRTTHDYHQRGVAEMWRRARDAGYIYKGQYEGWYCVGCNEFLSEDQTYEGPDGAPFCRTHERALDRLSEESYFFRLSDFQQRLLDLYESRPEFIQPDARRNEVIRFVSGGLNDLSVSRVSVKWGIPAPDDPAHTIYVWFDALSNYITAVGFGVDTRNLEGEVTGDDAQFRRYWPADLHLVGKDILRFHAVYWPAFLMAAGIELPRQVYAHGMWMSGGRKMSKSLGNVIDLNTLRRHFTPDAVRYFCLREMVFGQDGDFTYEALLDRVNADLAAGLGNLSSRTLTMVRNYCGGEIPAADTGEDRAPASLTDGAIGVRAAVESAVEDFDRGFESCSFSRALEAVWAAIARVDKFISDAKPWDLAKEPENRAPLELVLATSTAALRRLTALLAPVLPEAAQQIWEQLGEQGEAIGVAPASLAWGAAPGQRIGEIKGVFPRLDKKRIMEEIKQQEIKDQIREEKTTGEPGASPVVVADTQPLDTPPAVVETETPGIAWIGIEDFVKVELRAGEVLTAERVPKADKLLRFTIDLGEAQPRQILAGIAQYYEPEKLIGRKVIVVANLAPRKLRGLESQGMILAASIGEEGRPVLAGFLEEVPNGAKLK
ncbi:MAG: methionine--tRNA ligase [Blastocatellales bacterium]|nr:methionine--tRNA ligase [Blastocatellales bacterium]